MEASGASVFQQLLALRLLLISRYIWRYIGGRGEAGSGEGGLLLGGQVGNMSRQETEGKGESKEEIRTGDMMYTRSKVSLQ